MGTARRRKLLDPNFGKPKLLTRAEILDCLLQRPLTIETIERIHASIVPSDIARSAFQFAVMTNSTSEVMPERLLKLKHERKWTSEMLNILWNSETRSWVEETATALVAEFPDFAEVKDGVESLLVKAVCLPAEHRAANYFDLIESGECDYPPTLEGFWRGEKEGRPPDPYEFDEFEEDEP